MDIRPVGREARLSVTGSSKRRPAPPLSTPTRPAPPDRRTRPSPPLTGWPAATALLAVVAVVGSLALAGALDRVRVDRGPAEWAVIAAAFGGGMVSVTGQPARWWRRWGAGCALAATALVVAGAVLISAANLDGGTPYPSEFLLYGWVALFVAGAGLCGVASGPVLVRTARALTAPAALLAAFLVINGFYGYWPTVDALLNHPLASQVSSKKLAAGIHDRSPLPAVGEFGPVYISGAAVGFRASTSYLYLPPDYNRVPHRNLDVIVTLTGIPGRAEDWAVAGGAVAASTAWAKAHGGNAPVVLMVDENGLPGHDTECLNSRQGQAYSYLTEVIPSYLTHRLGIRHDSRRWGVVGFSEGGTCALMLPLTDPALFGKFMDISGDAAPNFGPTAATGLRVLYGGSRVLERGHTPRLLLRHHRYPALEGWFAVGLQDRGHNRLEPVLAADAARAGILVHRWWAPGRHTWVFARLAFAHLYPQLAGALTTAR